MYSDKENVNILTALLVAHGIHHAVVCPGSRNAPIVHNLNECPDIQCWPVTDERSAAFFALGMAQATDEPVVVCVTSGTALLNLLPAVAEAHYQHRPLVVVSADRPAEWIDQLDGQTLKQPGALEPWVAKSVSLPMVEGPAGSNRAMEEERWHCNRLVNEALIEATGDSRACVHINVPIREPLFSFTTPALPAERIIHRYSPMADYDCLCAELLGDLFSSRRPMLVFGQMGRNSFSHGVADFLFSHVTTIHEALADFPSVCHIDEVLACGERDSDCQCPDSLLPDFVLYVGDAIVSKRLKRFLRRAKDARFWRVNSTGQVEDTFQNVRGIMVGDPEFVIESLSRKLSRFYNDGNDGVTRWQTEYRRLWLKLLRGAAQRADAFIPPYSQMAAVRLLEQGCGNCAKREPSAGEPAVRFHYANSSAIRLANIYAHHHVCCNRGVNGIEGSLSTAVGYTVACNSNPASVAPTVVYCVIGDLSFFYDQNALWNKNLRRNLRILLLNNGKGGIFSRLPGLGASAASDSLVAGSHDTSAKGVCMQFGVEYRSASDQKTLEKEMTWFISNDNDCVRLLEVFTDVDDDNRAILEYLA